MTCTFFGHRDTPERIRASLRRVLTDLIENRDVNEFFVGNQGGFDFMVWSELNILMRSFPHISCSIVLAYMPEKNQKVDYVDYMNSVYPAGLEKVPRRFATDKRNRIMIEWSDIVITYVVHPGGASKYKEISEKKGKKVINLYESEL